MPIAAFLLALIAIIVVAKAFGEIAKRVGQPAVLGELLGGVVVGVSGLGVVDPRDATIHLLAQASSSNVPAATPRCRIHVSAAVRADDRFRPGTGVRSMSASARQGAPAHVLETRAGRSPARLAPYSDQSVVIACPVNTHWPPAV